MAEPRTVTLLLNENSIITKGSEKYQILGGEQIKLAFQEGILLRTDPSNLSSNGFILLKDGNYPSDIKPIKSNPNITLKAGRKLKLLSLNADITLNKDEVFTLDRCTKVGVPPGTLLGKEGMLVTKYDNHPMYICLDITGNDLFDAILGKNL